MQLMPGQCGTAPRKPQSVPCHGVFGDPIHGLPLQRARLHACRHACAAACRWSPQRTQSITARVDAAAVPTFGPQRPHQHLITAPNRPDHTSDRRVSMFHSSSSNRNSTRRGSRDPPAHPSPAIPVKQPNTSNTSSSAQYAPTAAVNLLVIEIFAGSYSAGRLVARLNSSNTGIRASAYAAVELDPKSINRAPNSSLYGIPDHEEHTLLINGSIADPAVHGKLLLFVQRMLRQSADGSGPVIDGVMLFGGPPCTMYSVCQTYLLPSIIEPDPDTFRRKLFASDRLVTAFLNLYGTVRSLCADPRHPHPQSQQPVPSCILMENSYSPAELNIKYTPDEVAASDGKLVPRQVKLVEKQNLSGRHFLQPYMASRGGPLYVTLHCWCSYAHLTHPKKPTYIFSDLAGLQDTPCICKECRKAGGFSVLGPKSKRVQLYQQHFVKVAEMQNGDGGERATWPDSWLNRMAWLFSCDILMQRRSRSSSSART